MSSAVSFGYDLAEILLVRPFSQLANNQFHRNPSASDHRLAQHDFGIDLDSVVKGHFFCVAPESQDQASVQAALDTILALGPYAGDVAPGPVIKDKKRPFFTGSLTRKVSGW